MTTLLAVYNAKGCVGRCDANCYNAKHAKCTCICGGRNHSAGLERASENVGQMVGLTKEDLDNYAVATRRDEELIAVNRLKHHNARHARKFAREKLMQPDLFDERTTTWLPSSGG